MGIRSLETQWCANGVMASFLKEPASGRASKSRPSGLQTKHSKIVCAQRSGPPAPQAKLCKNRGIPGDKHANSWCFLGGFLPFSEAGSSTFSQLSPFSKNPNIFPLTKSSAGMSCVGLTKPHYPLLLQNGSRHTRSLHTQRLSHERRQRRTTTATAGRPHTRCRHRSHPCCCRGSGRSRCG